MAVLLVAALLPVLPAEAAVKAGTQCRKQGATVVQGGKTFTCVKSGRKLLWSKGVASPVRPAPTPMRPAPQPTQPVTPAPPTVPTGFHDLYEYRAGISWAAWSAVSKTVTATSAKPVEFQIFTGPNTKPYYDDYPLVGRLTSQVFPSFPAPKKTVVIRYSYADLAWAEATVRSLVTPAQYENLSRSEGGQLVTSNCRATERNCPGSKQQGIDEHTGLILQGVPNALQPGESARMTTGQLEAHEYFHGLQRQTQLGGEGAFRSWSLRWLTEGSAEWAQNAVVNASSYGAYLDFLRTDCEGTCRRMTEADIVDYLSLAERASDKYDQWLSYNLGSRIVEVLVALKGQESVLQLFKGMAAGETFAGVFARTYGTDWNLAMPVIAKAVAANLAAGN